MTSSVPEMKPVGLQRDGKSNRTKRLRLMLTFAKTFGAEQIKQLPVGGPALMAFLDMVDKLGAAEAEKELDLRLERIIDIGSQTQEDVRMVAELAEVMSYVVAEQREQTEKILDHLRREGAAGEQDDLPKLVLDAARLAYRSDVAREYMYADYRGIEGDEGDAHAVSLPLDDVYVLPRLQSEAQRASSSEEEQKLLHDLLEKTEDLAEEERLRMEERYGVITGQRWRGDGEDEDEGVSLGAIMAHQWQLVVLGGPGVGKSTLVQRLARVCALGREEMTQTLGWEDDLTPIVISLAGYADARGRNAGLTLREYLDEQMVERGGTALRQAISQDLENKRTLLLIDGVDEIPDFSARVEVALAVEHFVSNHAANRFVVTSRPYGYVRLKGEFAHYTLHNLSPEQVEAFTRNWQRAFEEWLHPKAPDLAQAEAKAEGMLYEIGRNPKVEELATNPLMLVIIALIRHRRARLPEERVQLYNQALSTLLDTWNRFRSMAGIDVGGERLPVDRLVSVWGAIAEWTRRTKPTGVVHRAELKRKLVEVLIDKEYDDEEPEQTAESYLNAAADRAGLLEERGPDIFAFWHPTFEEFLAAVDLTTPPTKAIERLLPLRDDPRWREVILLSVGYQGVVQRDSDTATEIVKAVLTEDVGPLESVSHGHLRLAAACVADDVRVKRSVAEEVIIRLSQVARAQPYDLLTSAFVQTVRALPNIRPTQKTLTALTPLATHPKWEVRMEATRLFSNVAASNAQARAMCERLLGDDDPDVRCHAGLGLLRAGDYRAETWRPVANFQSGFAHIGAAVRSFLTHVAEGPLQELLSQLSAEDPSVRLPAARLLQEMGRADDRVVEELLSLLSAEDTSVRRDAARLLQEMGRADHRVVERAVTMVDARAWTALAASEKLMSGGDLDEEDGRALAGLVRVREDDSASRLAARELLFNWFAEGMQR